MSDTVRRALLIVGILAVMIGVGVADVGQGGGPVTTTPGPGASPIASSASDVKVTPAAAESSAWFCAGGTGAGGDAQATLLLTNPTARTVTGTLTAMSTTGTAAATTVSTPVSVPAHAQTGVIPAATTVGGAVASTVVLNGGGVGVSQVTGGPLGLTTAPCVSTMGAHWYFADASTAQGSTLSLSLFNPADTIAVVDVSFISSSGVLAPPAYQGIDVPGDSLDVENVGIHVPDNPDFATVVTTLSGSVVAAELEAAGQPGNGGPSVVLGATTPASTWSFAQNTAVAGGGTVFHVFNPSNHLVRVTVKIGLAQGVAEPLVLRVPPSSVTALDAQSLPRIPAGTVFAATFVARGGAGIVVDRHVSGAAGATAPQQGAAAAVVGGSDRWLLPAADTPAMTVSALAVVNLTRAPVTVRLLTFVHGDPVPVAGFGHQRVRPGVPLIVSAQAVSAIGSAPGELEASGPVAVEIDALPAGSPGVTVIPALPQS